LLIEAAMAVLAMAASFLYSINQKKRIYFLPHRCVARFSQLHPSLRQKETRGRRKDKNKQFIILKYQRIIKI
jgi:hypothetical protein